MESLPDDLLIEIIVRLPAEDVYRVARLVCWKWYRTIHTRRFIHEYHQRNSPSGLLFISRDKHPIFVTARQTGEIDISELSYRLKLDCYSGCNGFLVESEPANKCSLYISNPVTNQIFLLPPLLRQTSYDLSFGIGMAYAAASMEYKVVVMKGISYNHPNPCSILTVGVDNSWRNVHTHHLPHLTDFHLEISPLVNEGFIHWVPSLPYPNRYPRDCQVLTMNVETETVTLSPPPPLCRGRGMVRRWFLPTGRYLSLLILHEKSLWEVWEMKPETGDWRKLSDFIMDVGEVELDPMGWLKYPEILIFFLWNDMSTRLVYNLVTNEMKTISTPNMHIIAGPIVHKNSLLSLF